jgi:hypothetical protein
MRQRGNTVNCTPPTLVDVVNGPVSSATVTITSQETALMGDHNETTVGPD